MLHDYADDDDDNNREEILYHHLLSSNTMSRLCYTIVSLLETVDLLGLLCIVLVGRVLSPHKGYSPNVFRRTCCVYAFVKCSNVFDDYWFIIVEYNGLQKTTA